MPTAKVIVNPYAGRWKAQENIEAVKAAFDRNGVSYELVIPPSANDGIGIAEGAARAGFSPVVAVGGDGTYNLIVNGLIRAAGDGPTVPMGIIPLGTANDLPHALGLPDGVEEAVQIIARGQTKIIDAGRANGRYFGNNSAVGLEPIITLENARLVGVKGTIRYLLAALICIMRRHQWAMTLEWDDGRYEGPILLVSVGNTRRTGGVFFMTPQAKVDDGLLDFVFAPPMTRLKTLRMLPMTFNGSHIDRPEVTYISTTRLRITSRPGTPIQTDGEVFETDATEILYEVLPLKLTVIV